MKKHLPGLFLFVLQELSRVLSAFYFLENKINYLVIIFSQIN